MSVFWRHCFINTIQINAEKIKLFTKRAIKSLKTNVGLKKFKWKAVCYKKSTSVQVNAE